MKRFIKHICIFFAIIITIVWSLNTLQRHFNSEPPHYKLHYLETVNTTSQYNGIIIGNSQATHSIRPSLLDTLDVMYYNLTLNGSNPDFYLK